MRCQNPIGIFDSGIGGLSVWRSLVKLLPNESIIYVGDHAYLPYGDLSGYEIRSRARKIISWLIGKKCKLIIIACNTASVAGLGNYRKLFPDTPIIGLVPVVKTAVERTKTKHIAILATPYTINSRYHRQLLKKFMSGIKVENIGCSNLVPLIESGDIQGKKMRDILSNVLKPLLKLNIDVIALGCSHYPFIKDIISDIAGKDILILDFGDAVARQTIRIMKHNRIINPECVAEHLFFTTGDAKKVSKIASKLLKFKIVYKNTII